MGTYGSGTVSPTYDILGVNDIMVVCRAEESISAFGFPLSPYRYRPPTKRAPVARRIGWNGKLEVLHPTKGWRRA